MATRAGAAPRIDPMEHAKRLNAAKERARLLKEQRSHGNGGGGYSDGDYTAAGPPASLPSMPAVAAASVDSEWGPLGGAPVARRQPYGAPAVAPAPAPSSDTGVPGYRSMMTFGPPGGPPAPYGAPPAAATPYGSAAAAPAYSRQAEADETFYSMLRGGEGSAPPAAARTGGRARKPEWNSDVAAPVMDAPTHAAAGGEDDGGHAVSSAKARVLRMRQELGAAEVAPAAAKQYSGIVPERAPAPRADVRRAPAPAPAGSWDDMPVGAGKAASSFAVAEFSDAPVPAAARARVPPAASYPPGERDDDEAIPSTAPKLSLLKSKLRTGSARALVSRDGPPAPAPAPAPRHMSPADDFIETFSPPARTAAPVRAPAPQQARAVKPAPVVDYYDDAPAVAPPRAGGSDELGPENEEIELVECDGCGRKFKEEALAKHAKVCKKVFQTKRKAYDSKAHALPEEAQKLASTGVAAAPGRGGARAGAPRAGPAKMSAEETAAAAKKTAWEAKSRELREAMRAAREYSQAIASGVKPADIPAPRASAPDPSLVPCSTCGRSFSAKAAERHIPKCASIVAKPTMLRRGAGVAAGAAGASKMQAANALGSTAGSSSSSTRGGGAAGSMQSSFSSTASAAGRGGAPPFRSYDDAPVGGTSRGGIGMDRYGQGAPAVYGDVPSSARSSGGSRPPSGAAPRTAAGSGASRSSGYGQTSYAAEVDRGMSASGEAYFSAAEVLGRGAGGPQRVPAGRESLGGGRSAPSTAVPVGRASVGGYGGAPAGSSGYGASSSRAPGAPRGGGIAYRM